MKELKELIKISGLTEETLKQYEDMNLIKASHTCDQRKFYDDEELLKLWKISLLQKAGYELEQIAEAKELDEATVHNLLAEQRIKVDREAAKLSRIRSITTKAMQLRMMDKKFIKAISEDVPYTQVLDYLANLT